MYSTGASCKLQNNESIKPLEILPFETFILDMLWSTVHANSMIVNVPISTSIYVYTSKGMIIMIIDACKVIQISIYQPILVAK